MFFNTPKKVRGLDRVEETSGPAVMQGRSKRKSTLVYCFGTMSTAKNPTCYVSGAEM